MSELHCIARYVFLMVGFIFPKCRENNFNLIFQKGFHCRKHIGAKPRSVDSQRPVDFLITLHIAGRREKYTGIKRKREARESMPEN